MPNNINITVLDSGLKICSFLNLPCNFPPHFHDYYLLGSLENGERKIFYNGSWETLRCSETIFIRPRDVHGCLGSQKKQVIWHCLRIPPNILEEAFTSSELACLGYILPEAAAAFGELLENIRSNRANISSQIKRFMTKASGNAKPRIRISHAFDKTCVELERRWNQHVTIEQMGTWFGLTKYAFIRKFRTAAGVTPGKYLRMLRLGRSETLLENGKDVAATAVECGYYDQSHFTKSFKLNMGMTPNQWRKACMHTSKNGSRP